MTLALLTIGGFLGLSIAVQAVRDRRFPLPQAAEPALYLASGEAVEKIALSFEGVASDVYWIRAIQHYGDERLNGGRNRFALLYPLLDITTSLDPRFVIAYRFGALFLAEPFPGGAGRPDLAIQLLEKGLRSQPSKWEYLEDIGFVQYWQQRDAARAAATFSKAADIPGAPWWLRPLAATTLAKGGQRDASRFLWQRILESAGDDWQRRTAETRLRQLDALDRIDRLRQIVDGFVRTADGASVTWSALIKAGLLVDVPVDPAGIPFVLDPRFHDISVSTTSPLYPLPVEPPALGAPLL